MDFCCCFGDIAWIKNRYYDGTAGGIDIVACMIQKKKSYLNIENSISLICYAISGLSFFVYGNVESVMMAILHMLIFSAAMSTVMKSTRNAVKVSIITSNPDALRADILTVLRRLSVLSYR